MTIQVVRLVSNPGVFNYDELAKLPNQIPDLSILTIGRLGFAVPLRPVLDVCALKPEAKHLTLQTENYSASVLLDPVLPHDSRPPQQTHSVTPWITQGMPCGFDAPETDTAPTGRNASLMESNVKCSSCSN
jgi:hypothetical protein